MFACFSDINCMLYILNFYVWIRSHEPIEHAKSGCFGGNVGQDDVPLGVEDGIRRSALSAVARLARSFCAPFATSSISCSGATGSSAFLSTFLSTLCSPITSASDNFELQPQSALCESTERFVFLNLAMKSIMVGRLLVVAFGESESGSEVAASRAAAPTIASLRLDSNFDSK